MITRYSLLHKANKLPAAFADILSVSRKEYVNEPEIVDDSNLKQIRERDSVWVKAASLALALGFVTVEEIRNKGLTLTSDGVSLSKWTELPGTLFHVTTAKTKVIAEGLKTREELQQKSGAGLGGGSKDTISFTESLEVAKVIKSALLEAIQVAKGTLDILTMLRHAEEGKGAKRPWIKDIYFQYSGGKNDSEMPLNLKLILQGLETKYTSTPVSELPGYTPADFDPPEIIDGVEHYKYWLRTATKKELLEQQQEFYKTWAMYRESAGGKVDPMFFDSDFEALSNVPESEVAILQYAARPNAKGYKVSALGEWRTISGKTVKVVKEI